MATKNLARTIVEGGRRSYSRYEEKTATAAERRALREQLRCATRNLDDVENLATARRKTPFDREFNDKLTPCLKWLRSQVGRPWDDVYHDVRKKYDVRTTKGWHIIGHVKSYVNMYHLPHRGLWAYVYDKPYGEPDRKVVSLKWTVLISWDFEIDEDGILQVGYKRR